jgi:hypothetical protein
LIEGAPPRRIAFDSPPEKVGKMVGERVERTGGDRIERDRVESGGGTLREVEGRRGTYTGYVRNPPRPAGF